MRLENVLALTHGVLQSQPQISEFLDVAVDIGKVRRGSLFIAINPHEIAEAQSRGAYGIVYDRDIAISDDEIAWVLVDDVFNALKRMMRFMLIDKELVGVVTDSIGLRIAKQIAASSQQLLVLKGKLHENVSKLLQSCDRAVVIFERECIQSDLFTEVVSLEPATSLEGLAICEQTLFESAFVYRDVYYERQHLPPLFLPWLISLIQLLEKHHIAFRLRPFQMFEHFYPVFVGESLQIKEFGSSERVVIFEPDVTLVAMEIDFITTHAPWAQKLFFLPEAVDIELRTCEKLLRYKKTQDIINALENHAFHFAFVAGCGADILEHAEPRFKQQNLF